MRDWFTWLWAPRNLLWHTEILWVLMPFGLFRHRIQENRFDGNWWKLRAGRKFRIYDNNIRGYYCNCRFYIWYLNLLDDDKPRFLRKDFK